MEKHILEQYIDMQHEEKDIQRRIQSITDKISSMEKKGYMAADAVSCGKKGRKSLGSKKIHGFPFPEYERKKSLLRTYKLQLRLTDEKLLKLIKDVEDYIQDIKDSRIRRIMRYRYIDGLSWLQVSHKMGGNHTADSCRNAHDRFLGLRK